MSLPYIHPDNKDKRFSFDSRAYGSATLEDCCAADLGILHKKGLVEAKAAENTVRNQFEKEPFNCGFWPTEDGWQIGINGSHLGDEGYCLIYVSFDRVISFDTDVVVKDQVELWNQINECLIAYFFKK